MKRPHTLASPRGPALVPVAGLSAPGHASALYTCAACGRVVAHLDVGVTRPAVAIGLDDDSLALVSRLPPCKPLREVGA